MSALTKCWLLLCCVAVSHQLSIREFVVPNAVQSGENVELKCSFELNADESEAALFVKWWMTPLDSEDDRTQLYQRIVGTPGASIQHNVEIKEQDTIVLLNVTPAYSAIYECEVSNIDEVRMHQELVVFTQGTGPQVNVSVIADGPDEDEEDDVLVECEASSVAPLPDLILTVDGSEVNLTEFISGPDEDGLYEIFGNTTVAMADADGAEVRCELVFINPNITHQPYVDTILFDPSGAGSTTEMPEDAIENTTPESGDHGSHTKASWLTMLTVGVMARLTSLL